MGTTGAGADEGSCDARTEEPPPGDLFQAPFLPGVYVGSGFSLHVCPWQCPHPLEAMGVTPGKVRSPDASNQFCCVFGSVT